MDNKTKIMLVLAMTFGLAASNGNSKPMPDEPGLSEEFNMVPIARFQDKSYNFSRALASKQSLNNRLIILYNGTNEGLINKTQVGAIEATNDGYKVTGIIVGARNPEVRESVEMFYNGQSVTYRADADREDLAADVEKNIKNLFDKEIIVTASVDGALSGQKVASNGGRQP